MELAVRINPIAITDIREIIAYIAEDNPEAAAKIRNAIYSKIETLAAFPEMGASLSAKINMKTDYRPGCTGTLPRTKLGLGPQAVFSGFSSEFGRAIEPIQNSPKVFRKEVSP